jgi:hypothetical protein
MIPLCGDNGDCGFLLGSCWPEVGIGLLAYMPDESDGLIANNSTIWVFGLHDCSLLIVAGLLFGMGSQHCFVSSH